MANEQGRFTGTTIIATIGETVGLGQVVYSKRAPGTLPPELVEKGVWYKAASDHSYVQNASGYMYDGMNQIGVVVEAATYSPISATQTGTTTTILLDGYYSPGLIGYGGYFNGEGIVGGPLFLMPNGGPDSLRFQDGSNPDGTLGCLSDKTPLIYGATEGVERVVGYIWDLSYPYVIKFQPDNSWELYQNLDRVFG